MKKFLLAGILATMGYTTSSWAGSVPAEVAKFVNQQGSYTSVLNAAPAGDSGGSCRLVLSEYDSSAMSVVLEAQNSDGYNMTFSFNGARQTVEDGMLSYLASDSGKRAAGSVCGENDMLVPRTYKKTLSTKGKTLFVTESMRCVLSGKTVSVSACTVK